MERLLKIGDAEQSRSSCGAARGSPDIAHQDGRLLVAFKDSLVRLPKRWPPMEEDTGRILVTENIAAIIAG
jgi:hypothetical protein